MFRNNTNEQSTAQQTPSIEKNLKVNKDLGGASLSRVITAELIMPVLQDVNLCSRLFPHLPEHHDKTPEEIKTLIKSPQFTEVSIN